MVSNRRTFVGLLATGLAGCAADPGSGVVDDDDRSTASPTESPTPPPEDGDSPTPASAPTPATLTLRGLEVPGEARLSESFEVTATVGNPGGQPAEAAMPLFVRHGGGEWHRHSVLRFGRVGPGETATERRRLAGVYLPSLEVRVGSFERTAVVDLKPATREFAQAYETPEGVECTVTGVSFADRYAFRSDGERRVTEAAEGRKWAMVGVRAENPTDRPVNLPTYGDFALLRGRTQYDPLAFRDAASRYDGGRVLAGVVREGSVLFELPEGVAADDLRVGWATGYDSGDVMVFWQPSNAWFGEN